MVTWLLASLGYVMLIYFSATLQVENGGRLEVILNRIFFGAAVFGIVLFSGNYLNVQEKFILTRSRYRWMRIVGILLIDVAIFALAVFLLSLIMDVLA